MADRLDSLSEEQLASMVIGLEGDLDALKSSAPQFIGGASIKSIINQTGSTYDYNATLTPDPNNPTLNRGRSNWIITATAQHSNVVYAQLLLYIWVSSTASPYLPDSYFADNATAPGTGFATYIVDLPGTPASASNKKSWSLQINGDKTRNLWMKFYVIALDTVTVGITQTL